MLYYNRIVWLDEVSDRILLQNIEMNLWVIWEVIKDNNEFPTMG